jgi:hypothetical protein
MTHERLPPPPTNGCFPKGTFNTIHTFLLHLPLNKGWMKTQRNKGWLIRLHESRMPHQSSLHQIPLPQENEKDGENTLTSYPPQHIWKYTPYHQYREASAHGGTNDSSPTYHRSTKVTKKINQTRYHNPPESTIHSDWGWRTSAKYNKPRSC